jgi:serine/threonine protein kinase
MNNLEDLFQAWIKVPLYQDPVIIALLAIFMVLYWLRGPRGAKVMTRTGWRAHKAKQKERDRERFNQMFGQRVAESEERKRLRRSRRQGSINSTEGAPVALPDRVKTNATNDLDSIKKTVTEAPNREAQTPVTKSTPWTAPLLPSEYSGYQLIGSGGFADVYFALTPQGDPVAIKRLRKAPGKEPQHEKYFRREVRLLAALTSPAVPRLISHHLDQEHPYFVMEYISGVNLEQHVGKNGPLVSFHDLEALASATTSALREIHQRGLLHRDIKPSNVMFSSPGFKLIDLGIGKDTESNSTASQNMAGTLAFTAPEILTRGVATRLTDVFSWGAMMGYAVSGRMPYGQDPGTDLLMRVARGELDSAYLQSIRAAGDRNQAWKMMTEQILFALNPDPSQRPCTFMEFPRIAG